MEFSFDFTPDRNYYVIHFQPGDYESAPFIREVRFWGLNRTPCPRLSTLAALIALKGHPVTAVTLSGVSISPSVCSAFSHHFGVAIHPGQYDINQRNLVGGERVITPKRFNDKKPSPPVLHGTEVLAWISLNDLGGPYGGQIRTNLDAFDLSEAEKNLLIALCCGGKDVGHIILKDAEPNLVPLFHRIGLELVTTADAG